MLYIEYETGHVQTWDVGERSIRIDPMPKIACIQADGDELTKIRSLFVTSIPFSTRAVQSWYGDLAKTIAFALWSKTR